MLTGSLPDNWDDYVALLSTFVARSEKMVKPFRLYVDVDGVIMPYTYSEEEFNALDEQVQIEVYSTKPTPLGEVPETVIGNFGFNTFVAEKLSEWSKRDDVDFVWLTAWRSNAPLALDDVLHVDSVGYLPWQMKMADYQQSFKGVAIVEDQEKNPSKFVWIDDVANISGYGSDLPYFTDQDWIWTKDTPEDEDGVEELTHRINPDQYLTITPKQTVGLSLEDIACVDTWLNNS